MPALALALAAGRFRMPPLRVRARSVVEQQVTFRPSAASQPNRVDRSKLEHHLARQTGNEAGVGPLKMLMKLAVRDFQPSFSPARSRERGQASRLPVKPLVSQEPLGDLDHQAMQLP